MFRVAIIDTIGLPEDSVLAHRFRTLCRLGTANRFSRTTSYRMPGQLHLTREVAGRHDLGPLRLGTKCRSNPLPAIVATVAL